MQTITKNDLTNDTVRAFAQIDTNSISLFAGTNNTNGNGGVFLTTDNGSTWMRMSNGLPPANVHALAVTGASTPTPILFAGTFGRGVYLSTNKGTSWNAANSGLPDGVAVLAMTVYSSGISTPILFAGTYGNGVFLSTNNGTTWISVNQGLTCDSVLSLALSDSYLFAGTNDSGVWRRPLSDFAISAVSPIVSISNSLTNYPNPFSQSTTITFSTSESGAAEVTIVNLLGSPVARLFEGELDAGGHSFVWNKPTGLPVGMYECVVRLNGKVQQTPLILK
jgi:hypothetical protein